MLMLPGFDADNPGLRKGVADIDTQNYPEAVQNLLYAIYLDPKYSEAYYRLVQVAGVYGDASRALAVAEEALSRGM